ncbi:Protein of uncharacterised function (DUF1602) [Mycobacteroides abscessus subsp. abscessus]|nr:Protein of uncharacterised function (DUF1602) [Mycobacteroides abscessus subsp. abscessus]
MTIPVRPSVSAHRDSVTCARVRGSSPVLASSKTTTGAERTRALAIARRCLCPPESVSPRLPSTVS